MASKAMCARALVLLVAVVASHSLTLDEEATNDVIAAAGSAIHGGEVTILVRGPHGKIARREELLNAKGAADDIAISLFYNRKSNKVTLESLHGGHLKAVSWGLGTNPRGSLLLVMTSSRVKLFVGCKPLHWHTMSGRHNLLELLSSQKLKLYHEEHAPVEIYGNEQTALDSLNCNNQDETMRPPTLLTVDEGGETDVEEVKDFIERDARRKREEEMQGDEAAYKGYRGNWRQEDIDANGILPQPTTSRGDIPSNGIESCDDEVIRQLQYLRQTIEHLRREIIEQKGTIDNLRGQLRQCCNRVPPQPVPERCTGSSCYTGY